MITLILTYFLYVLGDNKDRSMHIFLRQKEVKSPSCVYIYKEEAHGIDLLIVNDFIFTHERKSSDEQLRKEKMKNCFDLSSSNRLFILLVRSTLLLYILLLHDNVRLHLPLPSLNRK